MVVHVPDGTASFAFLFSLTLPGVVFPVLFIGHEQASAFLTLSANENQSTH